MIRSTVVWLPQAENELARLWMGASDRQAIARGGRNRSTVGV
jgi:hypothetical protein